MNNGTMKIWIAFHGFDYEGDDIMGVYFSFEGARNKCLESIGGDSSFFIEDKAGKFYAQGKSQTYSVSCFEVEGDEA